MLRAERSISSRKSITSVQLDAEYPMTQDPKITFMPNVSLRLCVLAFLCLVFIFAYTSMVCIKHHAHYAISNFSCQMYYFVYVCTYKTNYAKSFLHLIFVRLKTSSCTRIRNVILCRICSFVYVCT